MSSKELLKAKDCAYRLLAYRPRSTQELTERLEKKGFESAIIKETIASLSALDYLNDEKFARSWVKTKMQLSPVGAGLLRFQLRQKGLANEIINLVLGEYHKQYDEIETAIQLVNSRKKQYKKLKPQARKRRLYGYLKRRGFSQEAIIKAIA
ncbi:MAG: regulatory protein RecX [Candidatus Omnitrophica bacterium]|nr:regulatory protein RecX [Candidatus Omnitrophota bacterium]